MFGLAGGTPLIGEKGLPVWVPLTTAVHATWFLPFFLKSCLGEVYVKSGTEARMSFVRHP